MMADISLSDLKRSIDNLNALFKEAAESIKTEPAASNEVMKKLHELQNQNSEIAEGIVTIADMVKDLKKSVELLKPMPKAFVPRAMPQPVPVPGIAPQMPQPQRQISPPMQPGFAPQPLAAPQPAPTFRPFPPPTRQMPEEFPPFEERAEAPFPGLLEEETPKKKKLFGLFK